VKSNSVKSILTKTLNWRYDNSMMLRSMREVGMIKQEKGGGDYIHLTCPSKLIIEYIQNRSYKIKKKNTILEQTDSQYH
jgi:hypothetical protein